MDERKRKSIERVRDRASDGYNDAHAMVGRDIIEGGGILTVEEINWAYSVADRFSKIYARLDRARYP